MGSPEFLAEAALLWMFLVADLRAVSNVWPLLCKLDTVPSPECPHLLKQSPGLLKTRQTHGDSIREGWVMGPSSKPAPSVIVLTNPHHPKAVHADRDGPRDAAGTRRVMALARSSAHPQWSHGVIRANVLPCLAREYEQTREPNCSKQLWSDFQGTAQQETM